MRKQTAPGPESPEDVTMLVQWSDWMTETEGWKAEEESGVSRFQT